jgi:hypothetical protein
VFVLFLYRLSVNTNNIYATIILFNNNMIYLMDFEIKIYHKMSKILTERNNLSSVGVFNKQQFQYTTTDLVFDKVGYDITFSPEPENYVPSACCTI